MTSFILIKKLNFESREETNEKDLKDQSIKQWKRTDVLKDYRFYIVCLNMLAMPWIATGVFVYQSFITEAKEWGPFIIAQSFMIYSILTVVTLFFAGFLVDKFTSRKLFPLLNVPLLLSLIVLMIFDHPNSAFVFMGFMGISNGLTNVLMTSFWAEIYGVNYLGSIKALTGSLMVFSTALATVVFGLLIDLGYSIENIAFLCSIYTTISIVIVFIFHKNIDGNGQ